MLPVSVPWGVGCESKVRAISFCIVFITSLHSEINEEMKVACADALAALARLPVPDSVRAAFPDDKDFTFGPKYLVPTPFDPRLLQVVSTAAAKAACDSGVARKPITDWDAYGKQLDAL